MKSALVLIHSRFSTNTFPSWELAHPYRLIAHNGEINTRARQRQLDARARVAARLGALRRRSPQGASGRPPGGSDTANFDNVLELLLLAGRSLPHAMMMMIPEAYDGRDDLPEALEGFYAFHGCLTEPWDGPASICFTDGTVIGATLDRNGLRPGRWLETRDGWVILASETGVIEEEPANILRKGRLQPGKIFLVDLEQGRIVEDEEVKRTVATRRPYGEWFDRGVVRLADLPDRTPRVPREEPLRARQLAFGYTQEDLKVILAPLARNAEEAIGSMGNDLALAVLSEQRPLLYSYFKQLFAQVTNPPIDSTREAVVMSVATSVGSERNLLGESPEHARQLLIDQPILRNSELESLRQVDSSAFKARTIDITWPAAEGAAGMATALARICAEADDALAAGVNIVILSDRNLGAERVPIPALLAVSSVHHHLVREGTRLQAGLVIESGEPREVHHFATLIGYGAAAINPYVMLETLGELADEGWLPDGMSAEQAQARAIKGIAKGAAEDDLEDGDLDDLRPTAARRSSRRSASSRSWSTATSSAPPPASPASAWRSWRARRSTGMPAPIPDVTAACSRSAASTPGGGTASTTVEPRDDRPAPALGAARRLCVLRAVLAARERRRRPQGDPARAAPAPLRRRADPARAGRAGRGDRQALRDRRDVARLARARGARDARDRDEPARRQVEHGRGRRGSRPLPSRRERRLAPVGDQAGRIRTVRRQHPLPLERRPAADQDGAGREAGRGRPAARAQGRLLHREDPLHHAGRRPDLAAAAP